MGISELAPKQGMVYGTMVDVVMVDVAMKSDRRGFAATFCITGT